MNNPTIERLESNVRSYCRSFPTTFQKAQGATLYDTQGRSYIDFFAGAGTLNYGHNPPELKEALLEYISQDGIVHALDLTTEAKERFLNTLERVILKPRNLDYKVMFPGPTGTNAVEAALKLARKITGRTSVIAFTNAFHGMTLGSLALTGNQGKRQGAGLPLEHVTRMPFEGYMGKGMDTLAYLETLLKDGSSGIDTPAAIIVESIQAEGGINVASREWLLKLQRIARRHGILFIVDDIQVGCGRTGTFFSFDDMGLVPDIVCLSKSLSGYGLPFSLALFRRELDAFSPGEHNGTFRGHNLAFVTSERALTHHWSHSELTQAISHKAQLVRQALEELAQRYSGEARGRGLIQGVAFTDPKLAIQASAEAFQLGLVIETSGAQDEVLKVLPPLTISETELSRGLQLLQRSVRQAADQRARLRAASSQASSAVA